MITLIPQSISATSQVFTANLTERLCKPFCVLSSIQPSVNMSYTIDDTTLVGTTLYVTVKAQGTVTYVPKNGNACCPAQKVFTEYFTTSFTGATSASSVTIAHQNITCTVMKRQTRCVLKSFLNSFPISQTFFCLPSLHDADTTSAWKAP